MANANVNHSADGNDEDMEKIYQDVLHCHPLVPLGEMEALADLVFSKERVVTTWRLAALVGSKDGEFFRELASDAEMAKALAPTVDALSNAATLLRDVAQIMEGAACRIMVAGCNHEDFNKWAQAN